MDLTRNDQLITGAGGYQTLPHFADDSLAPPFYDSSVNQESFKNLTKINNLRFRITLIFRKKTLIKDASISFNSDGQHEIPDEIQSHLAWGVGETIAARHWNAEDSVHKAEQNPENPNQQ